MAKIDEIADDQWKPVPRDPSYDPSTPIVLDLPKLSGRLLQSGVQEPQIEEEAYGGDTLPPYKCDKTYRLVIVRKKQDVTEQGVLFEDELYFFYISNLDPAQYSGLDVIYESNSDAIKRT